MNPRLPLLIPLAFLAGCAADPLTGAWRSQVRFSSGDLAAAKDLEFLYAFNQGGTMTESSNYDGAPPVPPAYGVWRALGPRQYEAVYVFYTTKPPRSSDQLPQGWGPAGRGELKERIEMGADGRSFESKITLELFDQAGKAMSGGGAGTGSGKRVAF